jgi:hypothetical protein
VEHLIKGDPRGHLGGQLALAGGQGLQGDADIVVAGRLIAGEGAGVATDVGQVRRKSGQKAHFRKFPDITR